MPKNYSFKYFEGILWRFTSGVLKVKRYEVYLVICRNLSVVVGLSMTGATKMNVSSPRHMVSISGSLDILNESSD